MRLLIWTKKYREIFLTISLTALITLIAVLPEIIKFSGNLYLVGDYMTQLIPFIKEGRRMFLSGTPFWSSNSFLGANFLGTYSYYLYGSPLFWPLVLFKENHLCIGITIVFIIKHIISGVSSFLFFNTHFSDKRYALLGALIYTFSSFTFDSTYYFIFLDVIAVFPLLLYFTEKALGGKCYPGFVFAVFINASVNYYCFIGSSVFWLIYLFFRVKYCEKFSFKNVRTCFLLYCAGALSCAVILLPAVFTLLDTSKAVGSFSKILISGAACIPQAVKLLRSIILPSEGILGSGTGFSYSVFCSNAGFLPFFGPVFTFIALSKKSDEWKSKLLKSLFIITFIPFGNGIFSLFSNVNYTRWWYAFVLIMVLVSLDFLESYENKSEMLIKDYSIINKKIITLILILTVPFVIIKIIFAYFAGGLLNEVIPESLLNSISGSGLTDKFTLKDFRYIFALIVMTLLSYLPLHFLIKRKKIHNFKIIIPVVAVICSLSYLLYLSTDSNLFFSKEIASPLITDCSVSEKTEYDSRTDFQVSLNNYSMIVNQPSINTFNSFKSKATAEFSRLAGFDTHSITKKYFSTEAIQTVLSISSVLDKNKNIHPAEYFCPFGYEYNYYIIDENYNSTTDVKENNRRIEQMCSACYIDKTTAEKLSDILSPLEQNSDWKAACKKNTESSCSEFTLNSAGFSAVSNGDHRRLLYFSIPNDKGWKVTVNGKETEIYTLNGGMIGIVVPEGESLIKASFIPPMFMAGTFISCFSIISLLLVYCLYIIKTKKGSVFNEKYF